MRSPTPDVLDKQQSRPIEAIVRPFHRFARMQASGGLLLLVSMAIALVWANSPWSGSYERLWHLPIAVNIGSIQLERTLSHWINDGAMALFFFFVGLEIKREILVGELASWRQAVLPIGAAIGGMLVPAAVFLAFNSGRPTAVGWGIPMATDIAFALGVLAMLGKRIPAALTVLLAAIAIVDDIGAILVIAIAYSTNLEPLAFLVAGLAWLLLAGANRLHVREPAVYGLLGFVLWLALLHSGVHATLAGVLAALTVPARAVIRDDEFLRNSRAFLEAFERTEQEAGDILENERRLTTVQALEIACEQVQTPLQRMLFRLQPLVTFLIVPLFALANAGIPVDAGWLQALSMPLGLGVVAGLLVGKPLGVVGISWLLVHLGVASLPRGVRWGDIVGVGLLAGIGFTMSMFIATLALEGDVSLLRAKSAILIASSVAAVAGLLLLARLRR